MRAGQIGFSHILTGALYFFPSAFAPAALGRWITLLCLLTLILQHNEHFHQEALPDPYPCSHG